MVELGELLTAVAQGKAEAVYLIEGDEYLARGAARELAQALVPEKDRALNLVSLDASVGAREIASNLMTIAMFAAPKAVVVEGADAFAEEVDAERELARARELWQGKRQRDAARADRELQRWASSRQLEQNVDRRVQDHRVEHRLRGGVIHLRHVFAPGDRRHGLRPLRSPAE